MPSRSPSRQKSEGVVGGRAGVMPGRPSQTTATWSQAELVFPATTSLQPKAAFGPLPPRNRGRTLLSVGVDAGSRYRVMRRIFRNPVQARIAFKDRPCQ